MCNIHFDSLSTAEQCLDAPNPAPNVPITSSFRFRLLEHVHVNEPPPPDWTSHRYSEAIPWERVGLDILHNCPSRWFPFQQPWFRPELLLWQRLSMLYITVGLVWPSSAMICQAPGLSPFAMLLVWEDNWSLISWSHSVIPGATQPVDMEEVNQIDVGWFPLVPMYSLYSI